MSIPNKSKLTAHQQFDELIDEYFSDLKDETKKKEVKKTPKTGDYVFNSVARDKPDFARLDENDEPPNFTDLQENEPNMGTLKIEDPLPKIQKRNELKEKYIKWIKTERLMKPQERRKEHEDMQKAYLETLQLTRDIKKDIKFEKVVKAHYPRGVVGVDSIYNENTVLYKDKYEALQKKKEIKQARLVERAKVLEKYNNTSNIFSFDPPNK